MEKEKMIINLKAKQNALELAYARAIQLNIMSVKATKIHGQLIAVKEMLAMLEA